MDVWTSGRRAPPGGAGIGQVPYPWALPGSIRRGTGPARYPGGARRGGRRGARRRFEPPHGKGQGDLARRRGRAGARGDRGRRRRRGAGRRRLAARSRGGPLVAIAAALHGIQAPHLLVLAADHPELRPELLALLVAERSSGEAVACRRGPRLEPLVAVYQRSAALAAVNALLEAGADRSLRALLGALRTRVVEEPEWRRVDPAGASFVDLDDPADLAAFQAARPGGEGRPIG